MYYKKQIEKPVDALKSLAAYLIPCKLSLYKLLFLFTYGFQVEVEVELKVPTYGSTPKFGDKVYTPGLFNRETVYTPKSANS